MSDSPSGSSGRARSVRFDFDESPLNRADIPPERSYPASRDIQSMPRRIQEVLADFRLDGSSYPSGHHRHSIQNPPASGGSDTSLPSSFHRRQYSSLDGASPQPCAGSDAFSPRQLDVGAWREAPTVVDATGPGGQSVDPIYGVDPLSETSAPFRGTYHSSPSHSETPPHHHQRSPMGPGGPVASQWLTMPERVYESQDRYPGDHQDHAGETREEGMKEGGASAFATAKSLRPAWPQATYGTNPSDPLASQPVPILRPALRHSQHDLDMARSANLSRGGSSRLEEGGIRAQQGVFTHLLKLYGLSSHRRRNQSETSMSMAATHSRADSIDSSFFPSARNFGSRSRCSSAHSEAGMELLDPDDPRITGVKLNIIDQEKHAKETVEAQAPMEKHKKRSAAIRYHISSVLARQTFILRLAKALMFFGAPSHRLESQLKATALVLDIDAEFVHMPSIVIASFGDIDTKTSQTHFIKVSSNLQLGRLHTVHNIYRSVVHDELGVEEATTELKILMKSRPIFGAVSRSVLCAACTALICPLAFGGSFLDMLISGAEGALLCYLQFGVASKNAMYSNVFEISIAIIMSFIARALSSIPSKLFCYSAISSSGVVPVLPGYMILCSALELASKNIVGGSVKLTWAIVYSLFLGFGLTIGSDIYFLIDPRARAAQIAATAALEQVVIHGNFAAHNGTGTSFAGTFSFSNSTLPVPTPDTTSGCYRDPGWPWYLQPFPIWSLFILVPAYSAFSSAANGQPFRSKQMPVMVAISCCSFAANTVANHYIFNRSDVVSAIGAFVVGLLGNLYSRVTTNGTSFTSMVTGVLFLVPAGIAATGGLSMNYRGQDGDEYSTGLLIGLRMVQVAIGITVGLFASSLLIYSFGRSKRGAIFAF